MTECLIYPYEEAGLVLKKMGNYLGTSGRGMITVELALYLDNLLVV